MKGKLLLLAGIVLLAILALSLPLSRQPSPHERPDERAKTAQHPSDSSQSPKESLAVTNSPTDAANSAPSPPIALPTIEELKYVDKLVGGGRAAPLKLTDALATKLQLTDEERAAIETNLESVRKEFEEIASNSIQERPYVQKNASMLPGGSAFYLPPLEGSTDVSSNLQRKFGEIVGSQRSDLLWHAIEDSLEQHPIIRGFGRYALELTFEGAWKSTKTETVRYYETLTDPTTGKVIGPFTLMAIKKVPPQYRFLFETDPNE